MNHLHLDSNNPKQSEGFYLLEPLQDDVSENPQNLGVVISLRLSRISTLEG